jgi:hypothetical protein
LYGAFGAGRCLTILTVTFKFSHYQTACNKLQ